MTDLIRLRMVRVEPPPELLAVFKEYGVVPSLYQLGDCSVLVSRDPVPGDKPGLDLRTPRPRWHISVSHPTRFPTWIEIGTARDQSDAPSNMTFCVPFPPRGAWLSIHPNCFHLWELRDGPLDELWRLEGAQASRIGKGVPQPERTR